MLLDTTLYSQSVGQGFLHPLQHNVGGVTMPVLLSSLLAVELGVGVAVTGEIRGAWKWACGVWLEVGAGTIAGVDEGVGRTGAGESGSGSGTAGSFAVGRGGSGCLGFGGSL